MLHPNPQTHIPQSYATSKREYHESSPLTNLPDLSEPSPQLSPQPHSVLGLSHVSHPYGNLETQTRFENNHKEIQPGSPSKQEARNG